MKGELVLTRSDGESVVIETADGPVLVRVLSIRGDRVRLGFVAPPGCPVMRGELQRGGGVSFERAFEEGRR